MAEALKHLIHDDTVAAIGHHLQRAWPGFDARGFSHQAREGLEALELKARVMQLARALAAHLPADADQACSFLEATLAPAALDDRLDTLRTSDAGLAGWPVWPLTEAVALVCLGPAAAVTAGGPDQPGAGGAAAAAAVRGLAALHAMTQRLTAEFAIRPFIAQHPALSLATLGRWTTDPSPHVRRLVSEGSRPRLPWGLRLQALVQDPSPTLPLLLALQDDASAYVRRSVANHLNDIAKDHPGVVAHWLHQHLRDATAERTALLRHASRSLVKAGHAEVLAAWGLGQPFHGTLALQLAPATVAVGGHLSVQLTLTSHARQPQRLAIDYAVHHAKAAGHTTAKVFKGWVMDLPPGGQCVLTKRHSFKPVTVRRYHPGAHAVDVRINGQVLAEAGFVLQAAAG